MTAEEEPKEITPASLKEEILATLPLQVQRERVLPSLEELVRRAKDNAVLINQVYTSFVDWYELVRKDYNKEPCKCGRVAIAAYLKDEFSIDTVDLTPNERRRMEDVNCCNCDNNLLPDFPSLIEFMDNYGQAPEELSSTAL